MQNFQIMNDPSELKGFWPVDVFNKMYREQPSIKGCAIASLFDDQDLEKVAVVLMRTFIENGDRAKEDQKYVVGIHFSSFGDMAIIDVISHDKEYHKEICYDHIKRMGWPSFNEEMNRPVNYFDETTRAPFMLTGGHLKTKKRKVSFFGTSGDYGDKILFSDSNSIAAYAAFASGIELGLGEKEIGESFVKEILQIMYNHKLKVSFYEELVKDIFQRSSDENIALTSQHIGALVTMKIADRMISEEKDMLSVTVDEVFGGGIGRAVMLASLARKLRVKYSED